MYCRVLKGNVQPGRTADAVEIIKQQADIVKGTRGFMFAQALGNGEDLLVLSSWRTEKDLRAYADSASARGLLARLSTLLVEDLTLKNYELLLALEGDEGFFSHDEGGEG